MHAPAFCVHVNELSEYTKCGETLGCLGNYSVLNEDSAPGGLPWSQNNDSFNWLSFVRVPYPPSHGRSC
jgi:hypothetical protein